MNIAFTTIPEKEEKNFRGGEKSVMIQGFSDGTNKIMRLRLVPGAPIGLHKHETNSETVYILEGSGTVLCDGETSPLTVGDVHYCQQGHEHSITNSGTQDLIFFAVVPEHRK